MSDHFSVYPIGVVRRNDDAVTIRIDEKYADAFLGLEGFSHILVLYWFHENDTKEGRSLFQVHPRGDRSNPLTGVFATHSPKRPNLIAVTVCRVLSIDGTIITIDEIDARDGSPVIDIKCHIPGESSHGKVTVPDWV